ncbi:MULTISPECIES: LPKTxAVK-anchored surface protein [unclassified Nioella]
MRAGEKALPRTSAT